MNEVFLDASYVIALSVSTDQNHEKALLLADELESNFTRLTTTRAVILEIGNALSRQRYREAAGLLLASLEEDSRVEIIGITKDLYDRGLQLYRERQEGVGNHGLYFICCNDGSGLGLGTNG